MMELCEKMMNPFRKVYSGFTTRFGIRKSGLLKLKRDVRSCEYKDIQVMWDMLKNKSSTESENEETPIRSKKPKNRKKMFKWPRSTSTSRPNCYSST